jgi:hypothetical protein
MTELPHSTMIAPIRAVIGRRSPMIEFVVRLPGFRLRLRVWFNRKN